MSAPERPIRVLIADDDALVREIAVAALEAAGCDAQALASGEAAIGACEQRLPDLLLLDVEMPYGSGYEACAAIRALPGGQNVPIVMVTGHDDPDSINRAYDAGATDFVVKPINWPLLVHRIRYVLRGARNLEALWLSERKNAALLSAMPDGIFLVDEAGTIHHCFSRVIAWPAGDASTCRHLTELLPAAVHARALQGLAATLRGEPGAIEFALENDDRATRHFECRYLPHADGQVLAILRDITARKEAEARIHRLAYSDMLTGLPNREWLGEHLAQALAEAQRDGRTTALLYVDLDQFKRINDTLGHQTGDALLRLVAERLTATLARSGPDVQAQLARVGGDEFVVVLTGRAGHEAAQRAATAVQAALAAPFLHGGYEFVVTPSIGIALYPEHAADVQSLLKNADGAMYEAKASGRNQFRVYTSAVNARAVKRLSLEMELRHAFETSQLEVYYQPKHDTQTLEVIGGEALLRWFHRERGQIPTADFIAVAEEIGLIGDIGRWVIERVCRDLKDWRAQGLAPPPIAANVSGRDFLRADAFTRISETVARANLPASLIELELTEGVLMSDAEACRRSLLALKEFGFALAVDDFGTGYCSLSYLKRFPLDTLKIDRSFVQDIGVDADDAAIVRAIIALGHNLNLRVVAEGVTTQAQLHFLRAEGCDAVQGYLMSPAVPAVRFAQLVHAPTEVTRLPVRDSRLAVGKRRA